MGCAHLLAVWLHKKCQRYWHNPDLKNKFQVATIKASDVNDITQILSVCSHHFLEGLWNRLIQITLIIPQGDLVLCLNIHYALCFDAMVVACYRSLLFGGGVGGGGGETHFAREINSLWSQMKIMIMIMLYVLSNNVFVLRHILKLVFHVNVILYFFLSGSDVDVSFGSLWLFHANKMLSVCLQLSYGRQKSYLPSMICAI